jgi:cation:H+ antiporter
MPLSLLSVAAIIAGLILLLWSADRFVDGAADIARFLGVPPLLVGMLVIGFGTSAPEMLVSGVAALHDNPNLGIGNAVGSNITNIALVLGVTALFFSLPVNSRIIRRELPILLLAESVALGLIYWRGFSFIDGIMLFVGLFLVLAWMVYISLSNPEDSFLEEVEHEIPDASHKRLAFLWTVIGLLVLLGSSHMLVWGATNIAHMFHVSDLMIGLTVVAIGTSLPELAATLMSAKKGETELAIGNIVGSNIFNTLGVLAIPPLLSTTMPIVADSNAIYRDMPIMVGLTLLLWVFARGCWQKNLISRVKGGIFLSLFIAYEFMLFYHSMNNITCSSFLCLPL